MRRLLQSSPGKIRTYFEDSDGAAVAVTGTPTVTVTDGANAAVITAQNATIDDETGEWTYSLTPTHTANLDVYKAVWSGVVSGVTQTRTEWFEVVGAHYFSVGEARRFDNAALSSDSEYETQRIVETRDEISERIEDLTGVSWVRRGRRLTLNGSDSATLRLPNLKLYRVISLAVTDAGGTVDTFDATELADLSVQDWGELRRDTLGSFLGGYRNVSIYYEHGYDSPPEDIKKAALILLRNSLVPSNIPDRVLSFTDETGTSQLAVPGQRFPTGIPEVDAILHARSHRVPVIA